MILLLSVCHTTLSPRRIGQFRLYGIYFARYYKLIYYTYYLTYIFVEKIRILKKKLARSNFLDETWKKYENIVCETRKRTTYAKQFDWKSAGIVLWRKRNSKACLDCSCTGICVHYRINYIDTRVRVTIWKSRSVRCPFASFAYYPVIQLNERRIKNLILSESSRCRILYRCFPRQNS